MAVNITTTAINPKKKTTKKLLKVTSTKLPPEVHYSLVLLAQELHKYGILDKPSTSELLRLTINIMFNFIRKQSKDNNNNYNTFANIIQLNRRHHFQQQEEEQEEQEELPPKIRELLSESLRKKCLQANQHL